MTSPPLTILTFGPPSPASPCAHIQQANLLELNNLGEIFKGAGVKNLSQFATTSSGEDIAYNKLLGHQDGILADIVRREGMVSIDRRPIDTYGVVGA